MRCRGCSVENEAGAKFCTECGTKMSLQNNMVVLCDGVDDEGNACTVELFQGYKFCKECGKRVDHKLFERQMEVCKGVQKVPKECVWTKLLSLAGRDKALLKDAQISAAHFLPAWFHPFRAKSKCPDTSVGDSVEILTYILHGLAQPYYRDGSVWNYEGDFKQAAGGFMLSGVVESMLKILSENHDDAETRERMFSTALAVLSAIHALKLPMNCLTQTQMRTVLSVILISPDTDNNRFKEQKTQTHFFPDTEKLKDAVMDCVEHVAKTTKDPSWLYAMPLVHFLSGMCKPFDLPTRSLGHRESDPKWWGITSKLSYCINSFREKSRDPWAIPLAKVVESTFPLFEMDYLLPRTFVASLTVTELKDACETKKIPTEVALALLIYHCKDSYLYHHTAQAKFQGMNASLKTLLLLIKSEAYPEKMTDKIFIHAWLTWKISEEMVDTGLWTGVYEHIFDTVAMYLHAVTRFLHCKAMTNPPEHQHQTRQQTEHLISLHGVAMKVIDTIGREWNHHKDISPIFKFWNAVFVEDTFPNSTIKDTWNTKLSDALKRDLETRIYRSTIWMTKLVELYCCQVETFKPCLQNVLGEAAFKSIQKGYSVDTAAFRVGNKRRFSSLLSKMFEDEWKKSVPKDTEYVILNHVMKWPPYVQFVESFHKEADKQDLLSEDCVQQIVQTFSAIETIEGHLVSGTITVGFFRELWEARSKFPELVGLMCRNDDSKGKLREANVRKELKLRKAELQAYNHQAELITTLTSLCQRFKSGRLTSALDESLDQRRNIKDVIFKQLCNIAPVQNPDGYQPLVIAFPLSDKVKDILQSMHHCNSSSVFIKVWDKIGQERGGECQTLEDLVDIMWAPVKELWDRISTSIVDGTIHFEKFEKHIGSTYNDDYDIMVREMTTMKVPEAIANERVTQLQKHRQLETCVRRARVIIQFAKQYELTGNFDSIEQLAHQESDSEMRIFDDSLMKTCQSLKGINKKRSDCLNMFLKCTELVTWLKKSMEGGLKELKVFVDLASISAGDTPMEIDRVQVLHTAVTGYAPLIFELDKGAGYKKLLKTCETVWKELDANSNLPKMLKDTARHLEWLKNVQKAHGSVEVTSLEQASAINSRGVYCGGYVEKHAEKEDERMCGRWHSAHIDDLRATEEDMPNIQDMQYKSIADLISSGVTSDDHTMDHTTGSDEATSEMCYVELYPSDSDTEADEMTDVPTLPLTKLLMDLQIHLDYEHITKFNINIHDVLDGARRALKRKSFKATHRINIKFTDAIGESEGAVDQGGPKREFLRMVMKEIQNSPVFDGPINARMLTLNTSALCDGLYKDVGILVALSVVHGGAPPKFFSPVLYDAIVYGHEAACQLITVDHVTDSDIKADVQKLLDLEDVTEVHNHLDKLYSIPSIAGCIRPVKTTEDKQRLVQDLLSFLVLGRSSEALSQLSEGLTTLGVIDAMRDNPDTLKELFLHKDGQEMTAVMLESVFHDVKWSPLGSNKRSHQERIIGYWRDLLIDIEEDDDAIVTLAEILVFATGADCVPPLGFDPLPSISFLPADEIFPKANTCGMVLSLPLSQNYDVFKTKMLFGIANSPGFGVA